MRILQRAARFATIGLGLTWLTACAGLSGWGGNNLAGGNRTKTSGYNRILNASQTVYLAPGPGGVFGAYTSNGVAKMGNGGRTQGEVRSYYKFYDGSAGYYFDPGYLGFGVASQPNGSVLSMTITDTSGDGYVSGGTFNCGVTSMFGNALIPGSAFFQDTVTCVTPMPTATGASTTSTDDIGFGGMGFTEQDPGGILSLFDRIPFDVKVELMNSVDTSKDVRIQKDAKGVAIEVVRLNITNVRIGGKSYSPVGVYGDLYGFRNMVVQPTAGLKLLDAWVANQLETAMNRHVTKLNASVTINGSVTVSSDRLPALHYSVAPTQTVIDTLRARATSNVRGE